MSFKKLLTTGKVWITSDTHYGHKNIVRGTTNWRTQDGEVPVESTWIIWLTLSDKHQPQYIY